jgi:hypothetical protein
VKPKLADVRAARVIVKASWDKETHALVFIVLLHPKSSTAGAISRNSRLFSPRGDKVPVMGTSGRLKSALALLALTCGAASFAGVTVDSYETFALTNAYASVSAEQYFLKQDIFGASPASADVSADWTGTNIRGTSTTWHWLGSSHTTSTTMLSPKGLSGAADGSFSFELLASDGFVDPGSQATLYEPAGSALYRAVFTVDTSASYVIAAELHKWSSVHLDRLTDHMAVVNRFNVSDSPMLVNLSGSIAPGQYQVSASSSFGAPNFGGGPFDYLASGSFKNFSFTVQVPEPLSMFAGAIMIALIGVSRRSNRSDCL